MPARPARALHYPIRAVARMTGLSVDTLRAWERRYEAVVPGRGGRGRVYTDADVARLKQLGDLVRQGHAIGTIAALPGDELDRLLKGIAAHTLPPESMATAPLDPLLDALDRYDLAHIESTLNRHAIVLPPRELVFAVIIPLLQEVGARWQAGTLRPAQEHIVSAIVRSVLGGVLRATARPNASPRVLFATPSGERHELGLLSAALLTASAGAGVVYLGPDLPASDIEHAAQQSGARVILVSLTTPGAVPRAELKRLAKAPQGMELWVGGPEADTLLTLTTERTRRVESLPAIISMVSEHLH